ncbi:hypothetical protein FRB90_011198, partial [Tulasnella sp. 427]
LVPFAAWAGSVLTRAPPHDLVLEAVRPSEDGARGICRLAALAAAAHKGVEHTALDIEEDVVDTVVATIVVAIEEVEEVTTMDMAHLDAVEEEDTPNLALAPAPAHLLAALVVGLLATNEVASAREAEHTAAVLAAVRRAAVALVADPTRGRDLALTLGDLILPTLEDRGAEAEAGPEARLARGFVLEVEVPVAQKTLACPRDPAPAVAINAVAAALDFCTRRKITHHSLGFVSSTGRM